MGHALDRDIEMNDARDGEYAAELAPRPPDGGRGDGGYLLAVMRNALRQSAGAKEDPIAVSAHYLSASPPGPATVSTRVLRDGGSVATLAADLAQDGRTRITAL